MHDPARIPVQTAALGALAWLAVAPLAQAQQNATPTSTEAVDEKSFKADPPGLYANADLSYVLTSGNSSSSSLGFKGDIARRFTKQSISFAAGGLTYTSEDFAVDDGRDHSFFGVRVGWDLRQKLSSNTTFTHTLIFDQSLEHGSDSRFDAQFGLHVAMNSKLGLKVNWRILYDNDPASQELPLVTPDGVPTGIKVLAPYKKTDQGLSVSLVFSIAPPKKG